MDLNDFLEEAAIMKEMKHANLVQLLGNCSCHYWLTIDDLFYVVAVAWWKLIVLISSSVRCRCLHERASVLHRNGVHESRKSAGLSARRQPRRTRPDCVVLHGHTDSVRHGILGSKMFHSSVLLIVVNTLHMRYCKSAPFWIQILLQQVCKEIIIIIIIIKAICNMQDPLKKATNALSSSEKM